MGRGELFFLSKDGFPFFVWKLFVKSENVLGCVGEERGEGRGGGDLFSFFGSMGGEGFPNEIMISPLPVIVAQLSYHTHLLYIALSRACALTRVCERVKK